MITWDQASKIYDVLVREAGASNREFHRNSFVSRAAHSGSVFEYRFGGALGFGGTFYAKDDKWFVGTTVHEDMNYQLSGTIHVTNEALARLKTIYSILRAKAVA